MKKMLMIIFAAGIMLTGCTQTGLVHDKSYLRAVYIGKNNEMTLVFFSDDEIIETQGKDIDSAVELAEIKTGKPIVTGFTELIILGECNGAEVLEYMLNDWKVSPSCIVIEGQQSDGLLRKHYPELITGAVHEAEKQGMIKKCTIVAVLSEMLKKG